jgi:hypothetical protein
MKKFLVLFVLAVTIPFSLFSQQNKKVKDALTYINEQFKEYNAYNMQWKVDEVKKTVTSTSTYYKITYPLESIETIEYIASDQVMEFTCKGDKNCISLYDLDNSTTSTKSSNRANLTSGSSIGKKVADAFLTIQSELVKGSGSNVLSTELPNKPIKNANVKKALDYINEQFKEYNAYDLQWGVDEANKILVSKSKYFRVEYPLASISEFKYKTEIVTLSCSDDGECITSLDLDYKTTSTKSSNTVNLTSGNTIGAKVIENFYIIQKELTGINNSNISNDGGNIANPKIKQALDYINEQFKEYNAYNMQWKVDEIKKTVTSTSTYYKITYPLETIETIEYIAADQVMEFTCSGEKKCISLYDLDNSTTSTKSSNRANLTSGSTIGKKVTDAFLTIQSELTGGNINSNNKSTELPNAPIKNAKVKEALEFINEQFKEYNAYDMQWGIDEQKKILVSKSMYFRVEYPLESIESFTFSSKIVKLTCSDGDCISSYDLEYKTTTSKSSNTVNLTSNTTLGEKVIEAFYTIKSELTGGSNIKINNNVNNAKIDEALEYINTQFDIYNIYEVQFWLEKDKGNIKSKSKYFEVTYPIKSLKKIVLYERGAKDYLVEFYCKDDDKCIKSIDKDNDEVNYQSNYSVNLPCSLTIGNKVIASFETIVKELGGKLVQDDE